MFLSNFEGGFMGRKDYSCVCFGFKTTIQFIKLKIQKSGLLWMKVQLKNPIMPFINLTHFNKL